jgi:hypothetical protein
MVNLLNLLEEEAESRLIVFYFVSPLNSITILVRRRNMDIADLIHEFVVTLRDYRSVAFNTSTFTLVFLPCDDGSLRVSCCRRSFGL